MSNRKNQIKKHVRILRRLRKLTLLVLILSLFYVIVNFIFASTYNVITQSSLASLKEPVSFLFIGSDNGGEERDINSDWQPLADSIILATVSPENSRGNIEINTISVPRDTQAEIMCADDPTDPTGHVTSKINSSFSYGFEQKSSITDAIDCTKSTVENMFDTNIDYYVQTSFDGGINLVDSIGGITIDVPYEFCEQDSNGNKDAICFKTGKQTLDGEQALAYARQRKAINPDTGVSGDDFERNIRQQEVISSIASKILSNPTKYADDLSNTILNDMETNLGASDIMQFVNFGVSFYNQIVESLNGHNKVNIYVKSSDYARTVAVNPYADLFDVNFDEIKSTTLAKEYPDDVTDDNKSYMQSTNVYPITATYHKFKFPTESENTSKNSVGIELQMETLRTEQDLYGTTQEVPDEGVIEYYSEVFDNVLNN